MHAIECQWSGRVRASSSAFDPCFEGQWLWFSWTFAWALRTHLDEVGAKLALTNHFPPGSLFCPHACDPHPTDLITNADEQRTPYWDQSGALTCRKHSSHTNDCQIKHSTNRRWYLAREYNLHEETISLFPEVTRSNPRAETSDTTRDAALGNRQEPAVFFTLINLAVVAAAVHYFAASRSSSWADLLNFEEQNISNRGCWLRGAQVQRVSAERERNGNSQFRVSCSLLSGLGNLIELLIHVVLMCVFESTHRTNSLTRTQSALSLCSASPALALFTSCCRRIVGVIWIKFVLHSN
jgi:hypothetical protein